MKGYIEKLIFSPIPSSAPSQILPLGMPELEHPLLDYERYQQWGAFRELSETSRNLIKKPLEMTEIEAFDNHNNNCIEAFRFVVRLLNSGSKFPCSRCQWLRLRMRTLFGNDFFLAHLEGQKNLSSFRPAGSSTRYLDFLKPDFTLKRYYDLSCEAGKEWTSGDSFFGDLSLFMPCVWEMGPKDEDNADCGKLRSMLKELADLNGMEQVDYKSLRQKALALYKASCMFLTLYKGSSLPCLESCECMKWLWERFDCSSGECVIPSLMMFPNQKKHFDAFNDTLSIRIDIAIFLIKLLLCKNEEQSFEEINKIETWLSGHSDETDSNLSSMNFIFSFYKDIPEESKYEMIRLFLKDGDDDIDDEDLMCRIKEREAFCYHYMKSGNRMLFVKDTQNFRLESQRGDVVCLIISGRDFYEKLKRWSPIVMSDGEHVLDESDRVFRYECLNGKADFLVVFGESDSQLSPGIAGMRSYILNKIQGIRSLKGRVLILCPRKTKLADVLDGRSSRRALSRKTKEKWSPEGVYPIHMQTFFDHCKEWVKATKTGPCSIPFYDKVISLHMDKVEELSKAIWEEIMRKKEEAPELPEYYIKPTQQGKRTRQSWFMGFTEKHKVHNLSVLTVFSVVLFVFLANQKTVDENRINTLIRDMKRALKRQGNFKEGSKKKTQRRRTKTQEGKSTQGGIKYHDENEFFNVWWDSLFREITDQDDKKHLLLSTKSRRLG